MNMDKGKRDRVERALGEAYRRQTASSPKQDWRQSVMAKIRQEPLPTKIIPFPRVERWAWRAASVAAAAAAIVAVHVSLSTPRVSQLAWDIENSGSTFEWFVASRE
jgi:hypothetical protein